MLFPKFRQAAGILVLSLYATFLFSQVDTIPPVLTCLDTLTKGLANTNPAAQQVFASEILLTVSDDQSAVSEIDIGLCLDICLYTYPGDSCGIDFPTNPNGTTDTLVTFNCAHTFTFGAENHLKLWARDAAGNISTCHTRYFVHDFMGVCGPIFPPPKGGLIQTSTPLKKEPIKDVLVSLQTTPFSPLSLSFSQNDTTKSDGKFLIPKNHYQTGHVTYADIELKPYKNDNWINGVNAFDLLLLQKHLLGVAPITNPYLLIGADANASGSITPFDIIELRKLILGIYPDTLPNNTSWRFVSSDYTFSNPLNPFLDTFPEVLRFPGNDFCQKTNFEAVKIGDLDYSANYNSSHQIDDRDTPGFMNMENVAFKKGETIDVELRLEDGTAACQFTLEIDGLELIDVFDENGDRYPFYAFFKDKNALSLIKESESTYFTIRFKALKNESTHNTLRLTDAITKSLVFDKKGISKPLVIRTQQKNVDVFKNATISPNPFHSELHIKLSTPTSEGLWLRLLDAYGRVIFSEKRKLEKGKKHIILDTDSLQKGAYFLELLSAGSISIFTVVK